MILSSKLLAKVILVLALCFISPLWGQESVTRTFELKGIVRDQSGTVFPGLRIRLKSEDNESSALTDLNGEFFVKVPSGNFVVSTDHLTAGDFRAFLKVTEGDQNPGFLEFIVNWEGVNCSAPKDKPFPRVLRAVEPIYPAAAKAVRAGGEVSILLKIMPDGRIQSATAVSGHPLLRRAAEVAAAKYRFESDSNNFERQVPMTFIFLPDQDKSSSLSRLSCPNRVVVFSDVAIIQTVSAH